MQKQLSLRALLVGLIILLAFPLFSQEILTGKDALNRYPNTEVVRTSKHSLAPSYVKFLKGKEIDRDDFKNWMSKNFKLSPSVDFQLISTESDRIGQKHYRYQQLFNGTVVEHASWILHTKNDKIISMNGLVYPEINSGSASVSKIAALEKAKAHVGADVYKWELPEEEKHLKWETENPDATYYPKGELVFVSQEGAFTAESFRLAYKFNIYAHQPVSRAILYVDAQTGEIIFENEVFHTADVTGTAQTAYSGSQSIVADSFSGIYRLRESGRGNGINTFDMNEGTSYGNAVDFEDNDNIWNNANANLDEYATDAHWGAEMTYDYFWLNHNRNSIDGNGFELNSYVHYDNNYANAFWDGQRMTYGDGNNSWNPLTALDIAGHEITHGLTNFTASLVYQAESGALNESFSDIFGTSVEHYARPGNWNWQIGEDIGSALRSMSNPGAYGDPDTYFGNNWASLTGGDNGGVHTNSGVQNFWYYLLVTGGSGTNDNGDAYTVNGIGFTEASEIAFRNLTVYLTSSSDFADARFYAIQSAVDLFGGCTPQVEACTNAWYAVGVGPEYVSAVIADMSAPIAQSCSAPFTVNFSNLSTNGTTFEWDFGDGNTSTGLNPSHTYTAVGDYTVQLIADGGLCGIDTTVYTNYISIDSTLPCIVSLPQGGTGDIQTACSGTLFDSGGPTSNYGANEDAVITIAPNGALNVDLTFVNFDIEAGQSGSCNYDYMEIHDGPGVNDPLIGTYCNNNVPTTISSTGDAITIVFHSDPGVEEAGFEIDWNCNLSTVPPTADFAASTDTTCNGEVVFTDLSLNGPAQWSWDFGDGNTSNLEHPTHTYTSSGLYTVSLSVSNNNGSDVATFTDLIYVDLPATPVGSGTVICANGPATLTATGTGGDLDWYDAATGGNYLHTGGSYTTPNLTTTTSYFVEEYIPGPSQNLGPIDNTFGGGGIFNGDQHLVFDCTSPVTLKTVKVYADGAGDRHIELRNSAGSVIEAKTVYIPDGEQVITLDMDIPIGTDLQLGTQQNSNQALFRNNSGTNYPYTVGGGEVTITQASPGTGYYYFFYDWVIESPGCKSLRTEVIATVDSAADATINTVSPLCSVDSPVSLSAAESGGTWSGNGVSGNTFDPSIAGVGSHQVIYNIPGTCGDADTINVTVADTYDATINSPGVLCNDDNTVQLTAADAGGIWQGAGISDSINGTFDPSAAGTGTHTVIYEVSGNCGDIDSMDIQVDERADASILPAGPFCDYQGLQQLNPVQTGGSWSADCGSCIDAVSGVFDPAIAGAGSWIITYDISGNCPDQGTTGIAVSECLGMNEIEEQILIYPNPSNGQFTIEMGNAQFTDLIVTDISGKIVYRQLIMSQKIIVDIGQTLATGTYFLKLQGENTEIQSQHKIQIIR